jgi:ABC-type amino acid transport system permease subunit
LQYWFDEVKRQFILNFINDNRWQFLVNGLMVTLRITFFALLIGIAIGIVVAIVRSSYDKNVTSMKRGINRSLLIFFNAICKIYLTVIRGTPVVVQLMIFYFIILTSIRSGEMIGIIAFGINAGAYVAEIFRSGIMSVDNGQFEAGRSLGFNYIQTMRFIIIPQAFKNALPTLANEFIVLLKETAVVGYVAVQDLTKAGHIIGGRTFSWIMPLLAVALIYLILVMFFTWLVGRLERRLRRSER